MNLGQVLSAIIFLLLSASVLPKELCGDWERKIDPYAQLQESDFTEASATLAIQQLDEIINNGNASPQEYAMQNAITMIRGWVLRKAALKAITVETNVEDASEIREVELFCTFLVNEAFVHD